MITQTEKSASPAASAEAPSLTDTLFPGLFRPSQAPDMVAARQLAADTHAEHEKYLAGQYGKNVRNMLGGGLAIGAGATGLYYALKALKKPRRKDHLYDEINSGAPVMAKESEFNLDEIIGRQLPTGAVPDVTMPSTGGGVKGDPSMFRPSWGAAAAIGAGGLGLWGGKKLVDMIMARQKQKDNDADIEDARESYYAALRGDDKAASALDVAYDKYAAAKRASAEKTAENSVLSALSTAGDVAKNTITGTHTLGLLAMLGSGLYGGKAVYDWTRARNQGDNYAKAQASRARMKGLPAVWVDPEELARVKRRATEPAAVEANDE